MILIENSPLEVDKYYTEMIGRVLSFNKHRVDVYNPTDIFSAIDTHPEYILYFKKPSDYAISEANLKGIKLISISHIPFDEPYADTIRFQRIVPDKGISSENLCIVQDWDDVKNLTDVFSKTNLKTRVFAKQQHRLSHFMYCGWIIPEYHSLFLSSANYVTPLSDISCINYQVCNDNVLYPKILFNHSDIMKHRTGFELVTKILPDLKIEKA